MSFPNVMGDTQREDFRILTLNVFGAPQSRGKALRWRALGQEILNRNYDFVLLSEIVFRKDLRLLQNILGPAGYLFFPERTSWINMGGLAVFSKLPISDPQFIPYRCQGGVWGFIGGDMLLKKGYQKFTLRAPFGNTTILHTHFLAAYKNIDKSKEYLHSAHQTAELTAVMDQLQSEPNLIVAGDFNFDPNSPYATLFHNRGVTDSIQDVSAVTIDPENPLRKFQTAVHARTEFFWYRFANVTHVTSQITLTQPIQIEDRDVFISDHYGLDTTIRVS